MSAFFLFKPKIIIPFITLLLALNACKTVEVGALEYHRPQLGVIFNNHNTVYTYFPDTIFKENTSFALDTFDQLLYYNFSNQLTHKHYVVGYKGSLQTINLEECIVSIELKNQFATSLIACKTSDTKDSLFYAAAKTPFNKRHLDNQTYKILANELGSAMATKIDSLQLKLLLKKDPVKYSKPVEKTELGGFGIFILTLMLAIVLL